MQRSQGKDTLKTCKKLERQCAWPPWGEEGKDEMDRNIWKKFLRIGRFKQENKIN